MIPVISFVGWPEDIKINAVDSEVLYDHFFYKSGVGKQLLKWHLHTCEAQAVKLLAQWSSSTVDDGTVDDNAIFEIIQK